MAWNQHANLSYLKRIDDCVRLRGHDHSQFALDTADDKLTEHAWVKLPSAWINERGLPAFKWAHGGAGADQIAALMILTVISHEANQDSGRARVTYEHFCARTELSRAKVSNGLSVLRDRGLIESSADAGQSVVQLANFNPDAGWAKFPAKSMYAGERIRAFAEFRLRKVVELDALKLFFLMVARRDNRTNLANISYPTIEEYSGIPNVRIKPAISYLASHSLMYVEQVPRSSSEYGVANAYRIVGIDSRNHTGTQHRGAFDFDA